MLITDDCGLFLPFIPSFSSSTIKRDPVSIRCLCCGGEAMFCWFYLLWLFLFSVQSTFKGRAANTRTPILYRPSQVQLLARFPQVDEWTSIAPVPLGIPAELPGAVCGAQLLGGPCSAPGLWGDASQGPPRGSDSWGAPLFAVICIAAICRWRRDGDLGRWSHLTSLSPALQ